MKVLRRNEKYKPFFYIILMTIVATAIFVSFIVITRFSFEINSQMITSDISLPPAVKRITEKYIRLLVPQMVEIKYKHTSLPGESMPAKIYHPPIQLYDYLPQNAYFEKLSRPYVEQAPMIFTPFVTYAPAPFEFKGPFGTMTHNIQQFRYDKNLPYKKQEKEIRIFITGGSTAWGCGAPNDSRTISGYLERELNDRYKGDFFFTVVNAAAGGWGSTEERVWILNRISEYDPDIIISYSGYNDIDFMVGKNEDIYSFIHHDGGYYYAGLREYEYYNRGEYIADKMTNNSSLFYRDNDFPRKIIKNIIIISEYLESTGVTYIYALQPINRKSDSRLLHIPAAEILIESLKEAEKRHPYIFINHLNLLEGREEVFLDNCHLGDIGNSIVAENLMKNLMPVINRRTLR